MQTGMGALYAGWGVSCDLPDSGIEGCYLVGQAQ